MSLNQWLEANGAPDPQYRCCYPMGHKSTLQQEAETEMGLLQLMTIGESQASQNQ